MQKIEYISKKVTWNISANWGKKHSLKELVMNLSALTHFVTKLMIYLCYILDSIVKNQCILLDDIKFLDRFIAKPQCHVNVMSDFLFGKRKLLSRGNSE